MQTPEWDLNLLKAKNVYEPAEDTFLLLDSLEMEIQNLMEINPKIILEIGSGSGVIIAAIANLLKNNVHCIAVDVNPDACMVTKRTAQLNSVSIDVVNSDLLKSFDLREMIDIVIFNPPYVETEDMEILENKISKSWAGGVQGRRVIDRILPILSKAISKNGIFFLVTICYNDIEHIMKQMLHFGFRGLILKKRQIPGELLYVLKFNKT